MFPQGPQMPGQGQIDPRLLMMLLQMRGGGAPLSMAGPASASPMAGGMPPGFRGEQMPMPAIPPGAGMPLGMQAPQGLAQTLFPQNGQGGGLMQLLAMLRGQQQGILPSQVNGATGPTL